MSQFPTPFVSFLVFWKLQSPQCLPVLALAYLYGTEYTDVPILSRPDLFTVRLSFYNPLWIEFTVSSVCYYQGTLTVLECGSLLPVLSVCATSLNEQTT